MKIQPIQGLYYRTAKIGKVSSPLNPQQKNNITKTTIPLLQLQQYLPLTAY